MNPKFTWEVDDITWPADKPRSASRLMAILWLAYLAQAAIGTVIGLAFGVAIGMRWL